MFTIAQLTLRQPTRLLHASSALGRNQTGATKSDIKNEGAAQLNPLDDAKDSLVQQETTSARTVKNQPSSKKDNVALTESDQVSITEKENKQEFQIELTAKGSDAIHSDVQSGSQLNIGEKEQYIGESEFSDNKVIDVSSVDNTQPKHLVYSKFTSEEQNSLTMVNESLRDNTNTSTHSGEVKEKVSSSVTLPPEEYVGQCTEMLEENPSVSSVNYSLQSSSRDEPPLHDEVSYEAADENVMFEELFGSSGEEEDHKEDDSIIEGAFGYDSDDEMELGVAYCEMEQRKVEEEFKRITAHSTNTHHESVSIYVITSQYG